MRGWRVRQRVGEGWMVKQRVGEGVDGEAEGWGGGGG